MDLFYELNDIMPEPHKDVAASIRAARQGNWYAVQELEARIEHERLQAAYELALQDILGIPLASDRSLSAKQLWAIVRAQPEQRAQAFLRAMEYHL